MAKRDYFRGMVKLSKSSAVLFPALISCARSEHAQQHAGQHPGHDHSHHHDHDHSQPGFHHRFDDAQKWTAIFDDPARDAWQKPNEVVAAMRIDQGSTVVDLGAGTGYFLPYLSKATGEHGNVLALDVEPNLVEHMRVRCERDGIKNVETKVVAPNDPGLTEASADRILIVDTWHHLDNRTEYAKKLKSALRENGRLFIVDFTLEASHGPPKEHRLSAEQLTVELQAAGFDAKVVAESLPDQYILEAHSPRS